MYNIFRKCFHRPTPVVRLDEITYYGSSEHKVIDFKGEFVINLTGKPNFVISKGMKPLTDLIEYPFKEIVVPWPDFGLPRVKMEFWQKIHEFSKQNKWLDICIHCAGGHGRTGTALSSIIISNTLLGAKEAVELVRDSYCEMAVETMEQCMYLQKVDQYFHGGSINFRDCPEPALFHNQKEDDENDNIEISE